MRRRKATCYLFFFNFKGTDVTSGSGTDKGEREREVAVYFSSVRSTLILGLVFERRLFLEMSDCLTQQKSISGDSGPFLTFEKWMSLCLTDVLFHVTSMSASLQPSQIER